MVQTNPQTVFSGSKTQKKENARKTEKKIICVRQLEMRILGRIMVILVIVVGSTCEHGNEYMLTVDRPSFQYKLTSEFTDRISHHVVKLFIFVTIYEISI